MTMTDNAQINRAFDKCLKALDQMRKSYNKFSCHPLEHGRVDWPNEIFYAEWNFRKCTNDATTELCDPHIEPLLDKLLSGVDSKYHGDFSTLKALQRREIDELLIREADVCEYFGWSKDSVVERLADVFLANWSAIDTPKNTAAIADRLNTVYAVSLEKIKEKRSVRPVPRGTRTNRSNPSRRIRKKRIQRGADDAVYDAILGVAVIVGNAKRRVEFDHSIALGTLCAFGF